MLCNQEKLFSASQHRLLNGSVCSQLVKFQNYARVNIAWFTVVTRLEVATPAVLKSQKTIEAITESCHAIFSLR